MPWGNSNSLLITLCLIPSQGTQATCTIILGLVPQTHKTWVSPYFKANNNQTFFDEDKMKYTILPDHFLVTMLSIVVFTKIGIKYIVRAYFLADVADIGPNEHRHEVYGSCK